MKLLGIENLRPLKGNYADYGTDPLGTEIERQYHQTCNQNNFSKLFYSSGEEPTPENIHGHIYTHTECSDWKLSIMTMSILKSCVWFYLESHGNTTLACWLGYFKDIYPCDTKTLGHSFMQKALCNWLPFLGFCYRSCRNEFILLDTNFRVNWSDYENIFNIWKMLAEEKKKKEIT